jgi:catechol 2,3-dioxygenase-like lactoylglutathione lyase family enzyme
MINGAHVVLYSTNADADRAFLRDVLGLPNVDVGHGWLIFGLPPSEVAVHPAEANEGHELFLTCDSVEAFITEMATRGLSCSPIQDLRWGRLTQLTLPGGGTLGVYEPRHARPPVKKAVKKKAQASAAGRGPKGRRGGRPRR